MDSLGNVQSIHLLVWDEVALTGEGYPVCGALFTKKIPLPTWYCSVLSTIMNEYILILDILNPSFNLRFWIYFWMTNCPESFRLIGSKICREGASAIALPSHRGASHHVHLGPGWDAPWLQPPGVLHWILGSISFQKGSHLQGKWLYPSAACDCHRNMAPKQWQVAIDDSKELKLVLRSHLLIIHYGDVNRSVNSVSRNKLVRLMTCTLLGRGQPDRSILRGSTQIGIPTTALGLSGGCF